MNSFLIRILTAALVTLALVFSSCGTSQSDNFTEKDALFSFDVTADMREYAGPEFQSSQYFLGTCMAIKNIGKGAFMVSPGDIDPPRYVASTITKVLGDDYPWYPVLGNHEVETPEDMEWLTAWGKKDIPNLVRRGPKGGEEMTYSFDYKNAHFVVINQYYSGDPENPTKGDIVDPLYEWIKTDLEANTKPHIFVLGHEPLVSLPDYDNGRHRHKGDNLDQHPENSHRFQQLLREHNISAILCGHTHNFSYAKINELWQIDAGHARGLGDKGAPSTFLKFFVGENDIMVKVYRDDANGGVYKLTKTFMLD